MAEEEKDSWSLLMHFDYKFIDGKLVSNKPTTYTLAVAIPCRTCGTITDRMAWADTEPFNGHRLSCAACWEKGCPLNGESCAKCMHESKIQMILLGRMVNGGE